MKKRAKFSKLKSQRGAAGLMVTLLVPVFLGVAALGVDVHKNYVILPNELQNAADAGALAGAARLYNDDGTAINTGANLVAQQVAFENLTTRVPQTQGEDNRLAPEVVADLGANTGDVQRGHWAFGGPVQDTLARGFYPNASTAAVTNLGGSSSAALDANINFINAVRVLARRESTPVVTFFARIFGVEDTTISREAVAYIGFAGELLPDSVDQPIAICKESITVGDGVDQYTDCNTGRMLNSGSNDSTHNTAGWTTFEQEGTPDVNGGDPVTNPCGEVNANDLTTLLSDCGGGNDYTIRFDELMASDGGVKDNVLDDFADCWDQHTILSVLESTETDDPNCTLLEELCGLGTTAESLKDLLDAPEGIEDEYIRKTWAMTLPVITCPENNVGNCEMVVGAVGVDLAWIQHKGNDVRPPDNPTNNSYLEIPRALFGPDCTVLWDGTGLADDTPEQRVLIWQNFVDTLNLQNVNDEPATYAQKSLYFMPSCDAVEPQGESGGENFGVLAEIPVLVCPDIDKYSPDRTCLANDS